MKIEAISAQRLVIQNRIAAADLHDSGEFAVAKGFHTVKVEIPAGLPLLYFDVVPRSQNTFSEAAVGYRFVF